MEKKIITKEEADAIISVHDEKTKKLMIDCGIDVGETPYAKEAREEKHELLYDLLMSGHTIKG